MLTDAQEEFLWGAEIHSTEKISASLSNGMNPNATFKEKTPIEWMVEMYLRSTRFSDCLRLLLDAGATYPDPLFIAVLLNDSDRIKYETSKDLSQLQRKINLPCAFTPLQGASLLHVAAEFALNESVKTLIELGADIEAKTSKDINGFNGHTAIFHTVNQHENIGKPVLLALLNSGAETDLNLDAIVWGYNCDWETIVFKPNLVSYTQAGLLPQFQRNEKDIYENIKIINESRGNPFPNSINVPNKYLKDA